MEAALSTSPCKRVRNPKRSNQTRSLIPARTNSNGSLCYTESLPKMEGVFLSPPFPLSSSLPRLNSSPYPLPVHQPPLLPLPVAPPSSASRQFRSLPTSVGNRKNSKGNKHQTNAKPSRKVTYPATRLGPDPESLPKDLTKAILGSGFPQAPPPSSLPMPNFSLRPKLSCKAEATSGVGVGRVDTAGATNNLCRLLNLR